MKIVESTDRYLELTNQNRRCLEILPFAVPFIIVGLVIIAGTVQTTTLECQRTKGNQIGCQRTTTGILGAVKDSIPGELRSVKTVTTKRAGIILGTTTGEVELTPYRASVTSSQEPIAERLNAFLNNPQQVTIRVEQDDRWIDLLESSYFLIWGAAIALYALAIPTRMSCQLDRDADRVTIDKKYLLYGHRQTILPLPTIKQAQVKELLYSIMSGGRQPLYTIDLIPFDAKKVSLSVSIESLTKCQHLVDKIDRFLCHQRS